MKTKICPGTNQNSTIIISKKYKKNFLFAKNHICQDDSNKNFF